MFTSERWRPVVDFEGSYEVSDQGSVRSVDRTIVDGRGQARRLRGRILSLQPSGTGAYLSASLVTDGRFHTRSVHSLVAEAFLGPRPDGQEVCHSDGDGRYNALTNLRYDTHSANIRDSVSQRSHNNAAKTHCPQNHPYTGSNLKVWVNPKTGGSVRTCRACIRARKRVAA